MKICHLLLDPGFARAAETLRSGLKAGDIVVVAPGKEFNARYESVLSRQLVDRTDAHAELSALSDVLKSLSPDEAFIRDADAAVERIYTVLCQGMSLSFRDNSLTDYLKAMFVQLCGQCASSVLRADACLDGREVVLCERDNGLPLIDWTLTEQRMAALAGSALTVVAGGYGRKVTGETVNLGAGGSELTANMIAAVLKAGTVRYYVGGFPYAESARLTYEEAAQRFSAGEPVYPPAMLPLKRAGIPAEIASLEADGQVELVIVPSSEGAVAKGITGVVSSGAMTLLTVYGSGLLGSVGISSAIFGLLAKAGVNIHFISQSLSEYSISFAVKRADAARAESALKALVADTVHASYADLSYASRPVEIVSVFGQGMRNVPGISGKVYSALGDAQINVIASSQGGEELSISVVVAEEDAPAAQKVLMQIK